MSSYFKSGYYIINWQYSVHNVLPFLKILDDDIHLARYSIIKILKAKNKQTNDKLIQEI